MNINGVDHYVMKMAFPDIGKMLVEMTPNQDGVDLHIVLTDEEVTALTGAYPLTAGEAMVRVIGDAIIKNKGIPKFVSTYSEKVFKTEAA